MMIATWCGTVPARTCPRSRRSYAWYAASLMMREMSVGMRRAFPSPPSYLATPLAAEMPADDEPHSVFRIGEREGLVVDQVRPEGRVENVFERHETSEQLPCGLLRDHGPHEPVLVEERAVPPQVPRDFVPPFRTEDDAVHLAPAGRPRDDGRSRREGSQVRAEDQDHVLRFSPELLEEVRGRHGPEISPHGMKLQGGGPPPVPPHSTRKL